MTDEDTIYRNNLPLRIKVNLMTSSPGPGDRLGTDKCPGSIFRLLRELETVDLIKSGPPISVLLQILRLWGKKTRKKQNKSNVGEKESWKKIRFYGER